MEDFLYNLKNRFQRFLKGYSTYDCISLHSWFGETFPEMVIKSRDMSFGFPESDFEEVNNFEIGWIENVSKDVIHSKVKNDFEEELDLKDKFDRWLLVLTRIAWCLEETERDIKNEYWVEYYNGNNALKDKWMERELEIAEYRDKCKDEAFDLIKKYFWNLWV